MIPFPEVKKIEPKRGVFVLDNTVTVRGESDPVHVFLHWIQDLSGIPIRDGTGGRPVSFEIAPVDSRNPEAYEIRVERNRISVNAPEKRGLIWAAATLVELLERQDSDWIIPCCGISDEPYKPIRGTHIYVPGPDSIPFFKRYVRDFLSRHKLNTVILEVGGGVRLHRHPELALGWRRTVEAWYGLGETIWEYGEGLPLGPEGRFQASAHRGVAEGEYIEREDLAELVRYAGRFGVELIPEIQSLAHVYYLVCPHPELAEIPEAAFPDAYCPSNPESRRLLFEVMDEYISIIQPRTIHIGHDEWRAGAFCPRCAGRDAADLFAEDVIKIWEYMNDRGLNMWMWGDHLLESHNAKARSRRDGIVWYDRPSTVGARERIAKETKNVVITDWSWGLDDQSDQILGESGFKVVYGNFDPIRFRNWEKRSTSDHILGAEVSSWCAMDEFEIGKMHIVPATHAAGMLWSGGGPDPQACIDRMPSIRSRLAYKKWGIGMPRGLPSVRESACIKQVQLGSVTDMDGPVGAFECAGISLCIDSPPIRVKRNDRPVRLNIRGAYESLIFFWATDSEGTPSIHAGDQTHYPRESSESLVLIQIEYSDGLVEVDSVRYEENIAHISSGSILYHCPYQLDIDDGKRLFGYEWVNPRPWIPVGGVVLKGTDTWPENRKSDACVIVYGIVGVILRTLQGEQQC